MRAWLCQGLETQQLKGEVAITWDGENWGWSRYGGQGKLGVDLSSVRHPNGDIK